jgi:hypothetical protein
MLDTSPEQREAYDARLRALSPLDRLAIMSRLSASVRRLAKAGIRAAHPDFSDAEVKRELAARLYGAEVAARLFGPKKATP